MSANSDKAREIEAEITQPHYQSARPYCSMYERLAAALLDEVDARIAASKVVLPDELQDVFDKLDGMTIQSVPVAKRNYAPQLSDRGKCRCGANWMHWVPNQCQPAPVAKPQASCPSCWAVDDDNHGDLCPSRLTPPSKHRSNTLTDEGLTQSTPTNGSIGTNVTIPPSAGPSVRMVPGNSDAEVRYTDEGLTYPAAPKPVHSDAVEALIEAVRRVGKFPGGELERALAAVDAERVKP